VCGHSAASDASFCGSCGAALDQVCLNCRRPNAPSHRFCDGCGLPLDANDVMARRRVESAEGERRHLTVLFADLVDSTSLSGRLDPEDLRRVMRGYQARCVQVINAHEGFVGNYLGDGIVAYFGFPTAHEEDALQAVRAAMRIVESVPELAGELTVDGLSARVGVHTGLVVVGEMGAGESRRSAEIVGEAPNVAARLQTLADPNQVVISGSVLALVEGFFDVESLGAPLLKGLNSALPAFAVVGETDVQNRLDAVRRRGLTPLVGRDAELGLLLQRWQATTGGAGELAVIKGEPGIGKSRLVRELRQHVEADRGVVVELRGSPRFHNSMLQPVIEFLRRAARLDRATSHAEAVRLIDSLVSIAPHAPPDTAELISELLGIETGVQRPQVPLGPEARRRRTLEVLTGLALGLAEQRAALLVCEDVQWFDPTTVELMAGVLEHQLPERLFIVITHRSDHALPWSDLPTGMLSLSLNRLLTPEVDRIVAQLCGDRELSEDVHRQIADRTDGVPLFVEELTQMLLDTPSDASREVVQEERLVPSTLRELLMARLDRQGTAAEVAQLAATVGREVSLGFLRTIWTGVSEDLDHELDQLVESGLMQRDGEGGATSFTFKHSLVQDVAYDSLLKSARQAHHRTIAEALEERMSSLAVATPEDIAHHLTAAGLPERAVPYWLLAGERALERSADREAIAHLSAGLALVPEVPEGRQRDEIELTLLVRLGAPLMAARGYGSAEVEDVYRRALDLGDRLGEMTQLFQALYGIFRMHLLRAEYYVALDVADRLVSLAARADGREFTVAASRAVGSVLVYHGDDKAEAVRSLQHAIATDAAGPGPARRVPALNDVADAAVTSRAYLSWTLWLLGRTDEANELSDSAVEAARALGHPFTIALALSFDSWLRQFQGDVEGVRRRSDEAWQFATEQGFTFWVGWATIMRGWTIGVTDDPVEGAAVIRQGLVEWQATGSQLGVTYFLYLLADVLGRAGDTDGALESLREATTIALEKGEAFWQPELYRLRAELLASRGDARGADEELAQAITVATRQGATALLGRARESRQRLPLG
jgi:class 3 adenylate cyclase/predicted ATPase